MAEVKKESGAAKRLINNAAGLRYVNGKRLLPDNKGVTITDAELESMKKNPAFVARLESGEFEVK